MRCPALAWAALDAVPEAGQKSQTQIFLSEIYSTGYNIVKPGMKALHRTLD